MRRILVGGGARSGKSAFALSLARGLGPRRVYVATAEAKDAEMAERIGRHARERGGDFRTVEAPIGVVEAVRAVRDADVLVLDCVTFWLSNLLLRGSGEEEILGEVGKLAGAVREAPFHSVLVTNEVGMGLVPETPLGRAFRDVTGRAHQALAAAADEVYFGLLGAMIRLRPAPVAAVEGGR